MAYVAFNTSQIQAFVDKYGVSDITKDLLYDKGMIKKRDLVKVLANGDISAKVSLTVDAVSASAKEKIEAQGGTVTIVEK